MYIVSVLIFAEKYFELNFCFMSCLFQSAWCLYVMMHLITDFHFYYPS